MITWFATVHLRQCLRISKDSSEVGISVPGKGTMNDMKRRLSGLVGGFIAATFCIIATSPSALAALGGDMNSVQADQAQMRAQRRVTQNAAYQLHELRAESGTVVREFVSPQGKVFGVAWQGPSVPDLKQVLGAYYDEFASNAPRRRVHGPVSISTPEFVIQSGGHQRALTGRAYVPRMIPDGVKLEEIK